MELPFKIDFAKNNGLVPVIVQAQNTKEVLMLAYMNEVAFKLTLETGFAHYFSRSRNTLWKKGETSGHLQRVISLRVDCDEDTLLLLVEQIGAACHTNHYSCFYREYKDDTVCECSPVLEA